MLEGIIRRFRLRHLSRADRELYEEFSNRYQVNSVRLKSDGYIPNIPRRVELDRSAFSDLIPLLHDYIDSDLANFVEWGAVGIGRRTMEKDQLVTRISGVKVVPGIKRVVKPPKINFNYSQVYASLQPILSIDQQLEIVCFLHTHSESMRGRFLHETKRQINYYEDLSSGDQLLVAQLASYGPGIYVSLVNIFSRRVVGITMATKLENGQRQTFQSKHIL